MQDLTMEERMKKIEESSMRKTEKREEERERQIAEVRDMVTEIMATYAEPIEDVLELANHAIECGYAIKTHCKPLFDSNITDKDAPRLQSDSIDHKFGLIAPNKVVTMFGIDFSVRFDGVGWVGGGWATPTFRVTPSNIFFNGKPIQYYNPDIESWRGCKGRLKEFPKEFDKFYCEFMEFIDNIDKYKCFK